MLHGRGYGNVQVVEELDKRQVRRAPFLERLGSCILRRRHPLPERLAALGRHNPPDLLLHLLGLNHLFVVASHLHPELHSLHYVHLVHLLLRVQRPAQQRQPCRA
uniref:Uncharacterized protein n=1 Tax=Triticum urartu TaxID=4572 RepID=A0A8R7TY05_TRIUA